MRGGPSPRQGWAWHETGRRGYTTTEYRILPSTVRRSSGRPAPNPDRTELRMRDSTRGGGLARYSPGTVTFFLLYPTNCDSFSVIGARLCFCLRFSCVPRGVGASTDYGRRCLMRHSESSTDAKSSASLFSGWLRRSLCT